MNHLLVTNDFPPKVGGIQSYLWELWRRLDPARTTVLTSPHAGAGAFDASQPMRVERTCQPVLLPEPWLLARIERLARECRAGLVVLDPALPLGLLGPHLSRPYAVVLHGAEVTVPARLPLGRQLLRRVVAGADLVVAAGGYPASEVRRVVDAAGPTVIVPPGVDTDRFVPLSPDDRLAARRRFGLSADAFTVVGVSRLVPRKGFDVLVRAAGALAPRLPGLQVVIAGGGRDAARLGRIVERHRAPVRLVGRVADDELPALYGCADVFAMLCRNRWGGLEQEGFGIVFLEAAACGVPQIAGRSGGSHEAVVQGTTGLVVDEPTSVAPVVAALESLARDPARARAMGQAARARVVDEFTYDVLASRLQHALDEVVLR